MYTLQFYTGQLAPAYMYIYMYMYTCVTAVLTPVRVARGGLFDRCTQYFNEPELSVLGTAVSKLCGQLT